MTACDPPAKGPRGTYRHVGGAVTHRSDAGEITLGRLLGLGFIVVIACTLFLFHDAKHRMVGYHAVHDQGIRGAVTVTKCDAKRFGTVCTGNFVSFDGAVQRHGVRVNGVEAMAAKPVAVAIAGPHAGEAWTVDGTPWTHMSMVQFAALLPPAVAVAMLWSFLSGGPRGWLAHSQALRARFDRDRAVAHARRVRMGRVH